MENSVCNLFILAVIIIINGAKNNPPVGWLTVPSLPYVFFLGPVSQYFLNFVYSDIDNAAEKLSMRAFV